MAERLISSGQRAHDSSDARERFPCPRAATNPKFRALYDYWISKIVGDRLPGRQHIDPTEIRALLSNLMLVDVARDAAQVRFRIRLFGTGLYPLWQADLTGEWIEDFVPADKRDDVHAGLMHVVTTRQAQYLSRRLLYPSRDLVAHERLAVPLASDGETVDMLMGLYLPVPAPVTGPRRS
jgi:hypothetical protein